MASPSDIMSVLQNGVTAIRSITTQPFMGGAVTAISCLTTTPIRVVSSNTSRVNITFHNPGAVNLYVYPITNASAANNAPSITALGGSFLVFPGAFLTVIDTTQGPWSAFAASGSSNPLTVLDNP